MLSSVFRRKRIILSGAISNVLKDVPWNSAGRNPDVVKPPPSGASTMKAGRFLFSVPRPYEIHEPIDGRDRIMLP